MNSHLSPDLVFKAIADSTRRSILDLLRENGAMRASDVAHHFDNMTRIAISKHLHILKDAELVQLVESDDGRERHYDLQPDGMHAVRDWLKTYDAYWQEKLSDLKRLAENAKHPPED